jgi:hypothetical protein
MIRNIIDLLISNDHYNVSERIEIGKGKYEMPITWKQGWNKIKRIYLWQRK